MINRYLNNHFTESERLRLYDGAHPRRTPHSNHGYVISRLQVHTVTKDEAYFLFDSVAAENHISRRHVWGECILPPTGDTNTEFYFYVNTNHPRIEGAWQLSISGATTLLLGAENSTQVSQPNDTSCYGPQVGTNIEPSNDLR